MMPQLRFDDVEDYQLTAFATNTRGGTLQELELRHRRWARCEDRIRIAKDTGLNNRPLHDFEQDRIWLQIVPGIGTAGLDRDARPHWPRGPKVGPKRLCYRLFTIPATIAHRARRVVPTCLTAPHGPT